METCSKPNIRSLSNAQIVISIVFFLLGTVDGFLIKYIYVSFAFLPCWIGALVGNILNDIYLGTQRRPTFCRSMITISNLIKSLVITETLRECCWINFSWIKAK